MVFIAYDYDSNVLSIVNAKSKELAIAFWQGKDIYPNTVKCIDDPKDFIPLKEHSTGVYEIFHNKFERKIR